MWLLRGLLGAFFMDIRLDNGFATIYGAELWSEKPFHFDPRVLLERLAYFSGTVEPVVGEKGKMYSFGYPEIQGHYGTFTQTAISIHHKKPNLDRLAPAFTQSWAWPEARSVMEKCGHSLLVTDLMANTLPPVPRLILFHNAVQALLTLVKCDAIHWAFSQQFLSPEQYIARRSANPPDMLAGALNFRLYRVKSRKKGEMVMDTLGLAALGLPDLQVHFRNLPPKDVARFLYRVVYERDNIIQDGEIIEGMQGGEGWVCHLEEALVEPRRTVIDINPGKAFSGVR
jgi:Domain of unknown function (DUF4261)